MIVILVIVAGGAFFAGMKYQQSKSPSFNFAQGGQGTMIFRQRGQGGQGGQNFRPVRGDILSVDSNGLTVKLQDGSSKIVILSGNTTFIKEASATKDDLKAGDTVAVIGTANSDGSVTAQTVQINPVAIRTPTGAAQ